MSDSNETNKEKTNCTGWLCNMWGALHKPAKCSLLTLFTIGTIAGIIFWGGVNTGLEYTNRMEFCISCHEMKIPYEEYQKTVHYNNKIGQKVVCADCHVANSKTPGDYTRKFIRKIEAANDILGHLIGTIDTPEKFEAKRLQMAEREWKRMKAADSKECRNCHIFERMDPEKVKKRAMRQHETAVEEKKTCIDCHKGIAHKKVHKDDDAAEGGDAKPAEGEAKPAEAKKEG